MGGYQQLVRESYAGAFFTLPPRGGPGKNAHPPPPPPPAPPPRFEKPGGGWRRAQSDEDRVTMPEVATFRPRPPRVMVPRAKLLVFRWWTATRRNFVNIATAKLRIPARRRKRVYQFEQCRIVDNRGCAARSQAVSTFTVIAKGMIAVVLSFHAPSRTIAFSPHTIHG